MTQERRRIKRYSELLPKVKTLITKGIKKGTLKTQKKMYLKKYYEAVEFSDGDGEWLIIMDFGTIRFD